MFAKFGKCVKKIGLKGDFFVFMVTESPDPADGDRTTPPEPILT